MASTFPTRSLHAPKTRITIYASMVGSIPSNLSTERNRSDSSNAVHYAHERIAKFHGKQVERSRYKNTRPDMERFGETTATFILTLRIFRGDVSILCQALCAVAFTADGRQIEREGKKENEREVERVVVKFETRNTKFIGSQKGVQRLFEFRRDCFAFNSA